MISRNRLQLLAVLVCFAISATKVLADSILPFGPGPNAVGCSNIAQDFTRVPGR